jgi:hypothetical protein
MLDTLRQQVAAVHAGKAAEKKVQDEFSAAVTVTRLVSEEYLAKPGHEDSARHGDDGSSELLEELYRRGGCVMLSCLCTMWSTK